MSREANTYNDVISMLRQRIIKDYSKENIISRLGAVCGNPDCSVFIYHKIFSELGGFYSIGILPETDYRKLIDLLNKHHYLQVCRELDGIKE